MQALILRFDAPLMAFGGISVDKHSVIERFPGLSMVTGFLANALGLGYDQMVEHNALQDRLLLAVRNDRKGRRRTDYQTVSLGQDFMRSCNAWTTRGRVERRQGTSDRDDAITIRYRDYWENAIYTLAIALKGDGELTLRDIERALDEPARPLFLGRKSCIPAGPVLVERRSKETEKIEQVLQDVPGLPVSRAQHAVVDACWPASSYRQTGKAIVKEMADIKDWVHGVHSGQRWVCFGSIKITKREKSLV